ncbi:azurocidin-like [Convolutriloba macropyga]|uniref:azurocidin-like n=1 Tax=Convolutriloba macropyga TaxID=536237 RepID=UPI003F5262CE
MKIVRLILFVLFANSSSCRTFGQKELSTPKFSRSLQYNIVNGYRAEERPFYVRIVTRWRKELICGGTIISNYFVLTAASCFENTQPSSAVVEVGNFQRERSPRQIHRIACVILAPGRALGVKSGNSLALVQLRSPVTQFHRILSLCFGVEYDHGTPVATCGTGSISGSRFSPTKILREIQLRENKLHKLFSPVVTERRQICREDSVCTTRVTPGGNSCFGDEGNPLYARNPRFNGSYVPLCLYGVATGYDSKHKDKESDKCNGGSHFARVSHFLGWIDFMMWESDPFEEHCCL